MLKAFERAYFQTRKNGPCTFKNSQYNQSCQSIYYKEIEDALKNQQNISIETTGKSIPTKCESDPLEPISFYKIVSVFALLLFGLTCATITLGFEFFYEDEMKILQ